MELVKEVMGKPLVYAFAKGTWHLVLQRPQPTSFS